MSSLEQQLGQIQGKLDGLHGLHKDIDELKGEMRRIHEKLDSSCSTCVTSVKLNEVEERFERHTAGHRAGSNRVWTVIIGLIVAVGSLLFQLILSKT